MKINSKKLSVGFLYDDSLDSSDGVARQVKTLGAWLSAQGHHVFYLCGETKITKWSNDSVYSLSKNFKVSFNGNVLTIPLSSSGQKINKVLKLEKPDIIHVQAPYSPLMGQRVLNRGYKNSSLVGTFHIYPSGVLTSIGAKFLGYYQRRSLAKLNTLVSVSLPAAKFAKQVFSMESTIIPNMVDVATFKSSPPITQTGKRIVFLGRLVERKGCRQLVEAFGLVCQSQHNVSLIIAGRGPQRQELEALVKKMGMAHKVTFTGFVDENKKSQLLASADIACFPSTGGESFGVVLIEAMAAGAKVVLGGDNPGYSSVLAAQPKLLINPNAKQEFAKRLELLLHDKALIQKLNLWQNSQVNQYDVNIVGQQYLDIYANVIAKRRAHRA